TEEAIVADGNQFVVAVAEAMEFEAVPVRIDDPVLGDAGRFVEALLFVVIARAAVVSDDLDGDVWPGRPSEPADDREPGAADEGDVRFGRTALGEDKSVA